ncbi:MAG TPA: hypothetical protein ENF34_01085 [Candidatus Bathyarchaeota archaeon]|nr:hypothetical protein [Candidatus Bathyarchaeota archaeon]
MAEGLAELKHRLLRLLEEDEEFRYAVAGYLGILEVLKRLDRIEEEQVRMREEFSKRFEAHERELRALREDFNRMQGTIERMQETIERMQGTIEKTQETISGILEEIRSIDKRLTRVERTLEKLTLDIEEEARSVVRHRLKQMGLELELRRLHLPGLEVNLYGASADVCVLGECSVRAGLSALEELKHKLERLKALRPDLLRDKIILLIYTSYATPELKERAEEEGIWVLKATGDIVPLRA